MVVELPLSLGFSEGCKKHGGVSVPCTYSNRHTDSFVPPPLSHPSSVRLLLSTRLFFSEEQDQESLLVFCIA